MIVSGLSGNEMYCLARKGFSPAQIVVGNSVLSLGVAGWLGSVGRSLAGGEVAPITQLIAEGRHAAIARMEQEATKHGARGITGVVSELTSLAGYTEFLAQGTSVVGGHLNGVFTTSASGIDLYCHLDAGYVPIRFAMGNVAYSLGFGRSMTGAMRTLARGEVREFSQMLNDLRHTALARLKDQAAACGANAVVDLELRVVGHSTGALELLITGTAAYHPSLSAGPVPAARVATSELTGEELWNLADQGLAPVALVTGTSVYSLGVQGRVGSWFQGMSRGELPELTSLVYQARENCIDLVRREAESLGAECVIGNKLSIVELTPGLIEIFAIGTAMRRTNGVKPHTPALIVQAVIVDREVLRTAGVVQFTSPTAASGYGGIMGFVSIAIFAALWWFAHFLAR